MDSNAPSRQEDSNDYRKRLAESISACAGLIEENGWIVWFYQDQNLLNWLCLYEAAKSSGLFVNDIISIKKQRRSMKTVTSPGRTLDGDLILIFSKKNMETIGRNEHINDGSYYDIYVEKVRKAMLDGSIKELAHQFKTVNNLINSF